MFSRPSELSVFSLTIPHIVWVSLLLSLAACAGDEAVVEGTSSGTIEGDGGKEDSGWLGPDTYEVGAVVNSIVYVDTVGEWEDVAGSDALQQQLIDSQIKFIKNTAEANGWRFNQLVDTFEIVDVEVAEDAILIEFQAVVDMLGRYPGHLPTLDELEESFTADVPLDPTAISYSHIADCSEADDGHSAAAYNFHYYFEPEKEECEMQLTEATVTITEVFPREIVYPEYDRLMQDLEDGTIGFQAALVPNRGDSDPLSRFTAHTNMLEHDLGLTGVVSEDERYHRYNWTRDGVTIVIDVYDPTKIEWTSSFAAEFRARLADYTLVHYNGHSSYGTKHLLDDPDSYSDAYQILMIHSCQSYAYYTRQAFRGKATDEDPSGFDGADIVATGRSSYPTGSPPTLEVLLSSLMDGMVAIQAGNSALAPNWLNIAEDMSDSTWGDIMYGIAGVRTNAWQPTP